MTKADFVNNVAKRAGFSLEDAKKLLAAFEDEVKELGKNGDSLTLPGFLTFKVKAGKALADHVAGY